MSEYLDEFSEEIADVFYLNMEYVLEKDTGNAEEYGDSYFAATW